MDNAVKYAKVKSVKLVGREAVYNMEVEKHHNFAVNGGLVVHNCIDALRYSLESESLMKIVTTGSREGLGI
mgnify:CR=1 FL=1|jgi:hypothetical protein